MIFLELYFETKTIHVLLHLKFLILKKSIIIHNTLDNLTSILSSAKHIFL